MPNYQFIILICNTFLRKAFKVSKFFERLNKITIKLLRNAL